MLVYPGTGTHVPPSCKNPVLREFLCTPWSKALVYESIVHENYMASNLQHNKNFRKLEKLVPLSMEQNLVSYKE